MIGGLAWPFPLSLQPGLSCKYPTIRVMDSSLISSGVYCSQTPSPLALVTLPGSQSNLAVVAASNEVVFVHPRFNATPSCSTVTAI